MNFTLDVSVLQLTIIVSLAAIGIAAAVRGDMTIAHDIAIGFLGALALHKALNSSPQP